jgi:imidazolonepropionase-like amidohydrolase
MAALQAVCTTIEHGSYLDEEAVTLMKEKNAILVPTCCIIEGAMKFLPFLPESSRNKIEALYTVSKEVYRSAVETGVTIALGSDLSSSTTKASNPLSHGNGHLELIFAIEAGMTPLQAIEAATANGPLTLGAQAPLSGQLREGYDADFIALKANPVENMTDFLDSNNITHVWKAGIMYKSPELIMPLGSIASL